MATLKIIRKRIISVKNTQKITKAMKMVAAAKLRRSQQRLMAARPYAVGIDQMIGDVMPRFRSRLASVKTVEQRRELLLDQLPLLRQPEKVQKISLMILSSDRGLCGGFNGNLLRRVEHFLREKRQAGFEVALTVIGKKGRDFFRARQLEVHEFHTGLYENFSYETAMKLAEEVAQKFSEGSFDSFYLAYNCFKSAISQEVLLKPLLPFSAEGAVSGETFKNDYIYEPGPAPVLLGLMPRWLTTQIQCAFLESMASEQGARMAAMDSASNNSRDMISQLTLQSNRLRQAAITKELMDIVNGSEALK